MLDERKAQGTHFTWHVRLDQGRLAREKPSALDREPHCDLSRRCSFCTDDRHAVDTLERGHINGMLAMAVEAGIRPVDAVRMATLNTAECHGLQDRGAIAPGRRADLLLVDNLEDFRPLAVRTKGRLVARNGSLVIDAPKQKPGFLADTVRISPVTAESFDFKAPSEKARMIGLLPHSLITEEKIVAVKIVAVKTLRDGTVRLSDNPGCVKLAVVERHRRTGCLGTCLLDPAYGLRGGAIATSVSHDSHNVVVQMTTKRTWRLPCKRLRKCGRHRHGLEGQGARCAAASRRGPHERQNARRDGGGTKLPTGTTTFRRTATPS